MVSLTVPVNYSFNPNRFLYFQVFVKSILDDPFEEWSAGLDFQWDDELEDPTVENMVRLILDGFAFKKEMFRGGLTANDLSLMRLEEKEKNEKRDKKLKVKKK